MTVTLIAIDYGNELNSYILISGSFILFIVKINRYKDNFIFRFFKILLLYHLDIYTIRGDMHCLITFIIILQCFKHIQPLLCIHYVLLGIILTNT